MNIEKIFILTVNRVDNQITYNNLPDELKKKVVFVVQKWEREKYNYDAEYLILPDHITTEHPRAISETRKVIYEAGQDMKYAMLDDDITFGRRNSKYWSDVSNMEKSKKDCDDNDINRMFELFSNWLDEDDVTVCGCALSENPPSGEIYSKNTSMTSAYWINGKDFSDILSDLNLTETKVAEDIVFLLSLLVRGFGNRVSQEFITFNHSVKNKSIKSTIWDKQTEEQTLNDHKKIEKMFPGIYEILYKPGSSGHIRLEGGFRNYGKTRINWSKSYKSKSNDLNDFFT